MACTYTKAYSKPMIDRGACPCTHLSHGQGAAPTSIEGSQMQGTVLEHSVRAAGEGKAGMAMCRGRESRRNDALGVGPSGPDASPMRPRAADLPRSCRHGKLSPITTRCQDCRKCSASTQHRHVMPCQARPCSCYLRCQLPTTPGRWCDRGTARCSPLQRSNDEPPDLDVFTCLPLVPG